MTESDTPASRTRTVIADIAHGMLEISHNGFAIVGLVLALAVAVLALRTDLRQSGEAQLSAWLQTRQQTTVGMELEPNAIDRATAANPKDLPKQQALVAYWLSKKYRVAPEPLAALVAEAYDIGNTAKLDPLLILSIMAVESSFNPFAQSPVGAQGLMQVMTSVHNDKYDHFGGRLAAFDPVTNLRVGVKVLQECIERAGSVEGGLKYYVGAAAHDNDSGYGGKVLAERNKLRDVAAGKNVSLQMATANTSTPSTLAAPAASPSLQTVPNSLNAVEPVAFVRL